MSLCASVKMCFVVTCWERADLLALVSGVYCEFVTFPLVSWVSVVLNCIDSWSLHPYLLCWLLLPLWDSVIVLCFGGRYFVSNSSFAIILMGKRELAALLCSSSWCLMIFVWLFLAVRRVCLQFVIVVFPDHTHYYFSLYIMSTERNYCLFWDRQRQNS